jgi:hypothetical protein
MKLTKEQIVALEDMLDRADEHGGDVATKVDLSGKYIRTPWILCEEIVRGISQGISGIISQDSDDEYLYADALHSKEILVIDTVEFIPFLLAFGAEKCKITYVAPYTFKGPEIAGVILGQDRVVQQDFLDWRPGVKFDVIIGNPPYQDGDREDEANKLWPFFVKKADSLLLPNGITAFITPNTWLNPTSDIKSEKFKIFTDIFKRKQLLSTNTDSDFLRKEYFPKVGSTFSWFIYSNSEITKATKFITGTGTVEIDLRTIPSLPKVVTRESLSIIGKMVGMSFHFIDQNHSPADEESREQNTIYQYPIFHTPAKGGTYWYCKKVRDIATLPKIVISLSGYYKPTFLDNKAFSNMCIALVCKTTEMARMAEFVLSSRLYRFWIEMNKFSGFNPRKTILALPSVDLSIVWTDSKLYSHFGITQEEIDYIEAILK